MIKENYFAKGEAILKAAAEKPRLLLHACCAPCSSACLEYLKEHCKITVFFYNPNMSSLSEYEKRANELRRLVSELFPDGSVEVLIAPYDPEHYEAVIQGLQNEKEGGARCEKCFELRLRKTAEVAKEGGFDFFTTTLTISPLKNAEKLNRIGLQMEQEVGARFLPSDFKKKGGYLRSIELSKEHNLYRQDFCGCKYSEEERNKQKRKCEIMNRFSELKPGESRCVEVIDMGALKRNFQALKESLPEKMNIFAVVKANSYGLGSIKVSKALEEMAYGFCVATYQEGVELREAGIIKPILTLGPVGKDCYPSMIQMDIRPVIQNLTEAKEFQEAAVAEKKVGKFHIAVDTGMSRIGLPVSEEGISEAKQICALESIEAEGIFSHLATMDCPDYSEALAQKERFLSFVKALKESGISFPIVHIANSIASISDKAFADEDLINGCRYGIALYGVYPAEDLSRKKISVEPVASLYSQVTTLKKVPEGTGIGYGRTFITRRETEVATVSCGYADGYPRAISGKGDVLICGERFPIIGRVCMDQLMVDVTDRKSNISVGDTVTLFGKDGAEEITLDEIEQKSGRLTYEVISLITNRVTKLYIE